MPDHPTATPREVFGNPEQLPAPAMASEQTTPSRAEQTVCVCGHTKRAHYFGDEMHTACQQEGCRCREYLSLVPVAAPQSTERDRIEELADRVREGIAADDRQTHSAGCTNTSCTGRAAALSQPAVETREQEAGEMIVMPPHGIMCFHCGETFTTIGGASDHFGTEPSATPGCLIDRVALEVGGKPERGRGLLMALRKAEAERDEWMTRALAAEESKDAWDAHDAEMERRFGTRSIQVIADRLDNERFRADHAMKRLDAAGIPFDATPPAPDAGREAPRFTAPALQPAEVRLSDGSVVTVDKSGWFQRKTRNGDLVTEADVATRVLLQDVDCGADFDALKAFAATPRETAIAAPTGETEEVRRMLIRVLAASNDERGHRHLVELAKVLRVWESDGANYEQIADALLAARVPAPSAPQEPRGEPMPCEVCGGSGSVGEGEDADNCPKCIPEARDAD